jgi:hypothetical protein
VCPVCDCGLVVGAASPSGRRVPDVSGGRLARRLRAAHELDGVRAAGEWAAGRTRAAVVTASAARSGAAGCTQTEEPPQHVLVPPAPAHRHSRHAQGRKDAEDDGARDGHVAVRLQRVRGGVRRAAARVSRPPWKPLCIGWSRVQRELLTAATFAACLSFSAFLKTNILRRGRASDAHAAGTSMVCGGEVLPREDTGGDCRAGGESVGRRGHGAHQCPPGVAVAFRGAWAGHGAAARKRSSTTSRSTASECHCPLPWHPTAAALRAVPARSSHSHLSNGTRKCLMPRGLRRHGAS